ncbi:ABC transporter ATP-binding protein [Pseudofrankia sp. BMG5.36]|uniref:ABC transporter ATP-binding protein n=1 Tax=Pseudofrankia sp. BMG5.36 TaxID=1834512 RepID=UPI0008D988EA|nr:ABC transporter ATP-binding protein [Pseudofrankia sp. BMG5.36]OHV44540.1 ABC transporter ATP-binding protein [Pseudofrankia sp. BMG5.36]
MTAARTDGETALLEASGLCAGYQGVPVVRDLDLTVRPGEVVALLGPNGAGKTTTLLTLAGGLRAVSGTVLADGTPTRAPLHRRAARGLALVTEERSVFMNLSTAENLRVGRCDIGRALSLFPELRAKLKTPAGLLSGGEQQMLTLARALARRPRLLLADELSLGLAPLAVARLLRAVRAAADEDGVGVLLVEQHVTKVLEVADRAYVLRRGRVELSGTAAELRGRLAEVEGSYLAGGVVGGDRQATDRALGAPEPTVP